MKHNFSGHRGGEFLGVMEHLRRLSCFPERNVSDKHYFVFHFSKPSLILQAFTAAFTAVFP